MRNLFLIVFIVFAVSCEKEKEEPTRIYSNYKISSSLYPYLFNENSYWIYKDTTTGNLDSVVLKQIGRSSYSIPPTSPGQGSQGSLEYFNFTYTSSYNGNTYDEQLFSSVISRSFIDGGFLFLSDRVIGDSLMNIKILDVIDSLSIENNTYFNVTKMRIKNDYYINGNYNYFYADSIGVIRKETLVNDSIVETWNLLRKNTSLFIYQ
jgi:hypothetical protein